MALSLQPQPELSEQLAGALAADGHVFVEAARMRPLLAAQGALTDWERFADSWNGMKLDRYMADGGRYRRRRYAVFSAPAAGQIVREAHQAHYQSLDYNRLNGGVARWFETMPAAVAENGACLPAILAFCRTQFSALAPQVRRWHVEVHQFRIEALSGQPGNPTPEGVHRDGVDYVLVLLVGRHNIASGTTTIYAPDGRPLGSFTLTQPFDATLIDDRRVYHGVTPVQALDPSQPAYRDVLVVTFREDR